MGYPVAVGVAACLARRQGPLEAKAAQFGQYSERFRDTWKVCQVDGGMVSELPPRYGEEQTLLPAPPAPGSDPFTDVPSGDRHVLWPNPNGTIDGAYRQPDGSVIQTARAPGDLRASAGPRPLSRRSQPRQSTTPQPVSLIDGVNR